MDIDVVAEAIDKRYLLVGECKWSKIDNTDKLLEDLTRKAALLPFASIKWIIPVVFIKETREKIVNFNIFLPSDVMGRLKI